jgi:hypothetical protein
MHKEFYMYDTIIPARSPLAKKANAVAAIFDVIAWIVLILGGLGVAGSLIAGLIGATDDSASLFLGMLMAVGIAAYTAVIWASVSLSTIIARYIASRS